MKRFYCTLCKKVKRVRRLPTKLENPNNLDPSTRIGQCVNHTNPIVRVRKEKPTRAPKPIVIQHSKKSRKMRGVA